jgi:hypothetical protein
MATHDKLKASLNNRKAVSEKARKRCKCAQNHGQVPHSYAELKGEEEEEEEGQEEEAAEEEQVEVEGSLKEAAGSSAIRTR